MASDGTSSPVLCINAGREPHRFVIRLRVLQSNISLVNRVRVSVLFFLWLAENKERKDTRG